jgi:hypothetical protein
MSAKRADFTRESGQTGRLPLVDLATLLPDCANLTLRSLKFMNGNVSPLEVLAIAALTAQQQPRCALEIGTFNGNSTLQIAANIPADSVVFTLDLPIDQTQPPQDVDSEDKKYVVCRERAVRRFKGTPEDRKIRELYGDSATFDFDAALSGRKIDFAFIDGSHSYAYVKNDTEKVLARLSPGAVVLWHDYHPYWPGVCKYLNELSRTLPVKNIIETTLVFYRSA